MKDKARRLDNRWVVRQCYVTVRSGSALKDITSRRMVLNFFGENKPRVYDPCRPSRAWAASANHGRRHFRFALDTDSRRIQIQGKSL